MNNIRYRKGVKEKIGKVNIPQVATLSTEDRLRIFANIVIDRILEEQAKGNLNNLIKTTEK